MSVRVGFLQAYFARSRVGGGERHTEWLARALERRGHEVVVCTDRPADRRDLPDLDVREFPTPAKVAPVTELALARRARPVLSDCDAVVLTDESAFLGVSLPVPTVHVFHLVWHGWLACHGLRGALGKPQALLYAAMERRYRRADRVVAISPAMREDARLAGCPPGKLIDVPNGVDIGRFHPGAAAPAEEFTVHFQGRLAAQKNPELLVEAAARAEESWRLTVGGDGPLRERVAARIDDLGVGERVDLLGYVPDAELPARYARSHVLALPSTYEGMPLTVLEAAASGTPAVATPRAASGFVTDEVGRVVEPDPDALARALDDLARDPDTTRAMGQRARERAEAHSWDAIAAQYESVFESLVDGGTAGSSRSGEA